MIPVKLYKEFQQSQYREVAFKEEGTDVNKFSSCETRLLLPSCLRFCAVDGPDVGVIARYAASCHWPNTDGETLDVQRCTAVLFCSSVYERGFSALCNLYSVNISCC
jgi:hypothetical protein